MERATRIAEFRAVLDHARHSGSTIGLVPTMGALHDGHLSLVERAARECDLVAITVFVNPLQFAAHEDLDAYPRDLVRDATLAARAGAGLIFAPTVSEMYPGPVLTRVSVAGITDGLEGASRPDHFTGVATVVTKLFAIAGTCRAYFGEKDYQQLLVVDRLVRDLSLPITVVGCPIAREADGVAMSSRNVYLSAAQREAAPVLHRALGSGAAAIAGGERSPGVIESLMAEIIDSEPLASLDYAVVRNAADLTVVEPLVGSVRLLVAAAFGVTRLLDNLGHETSTA